MLRRRLIYGAGLALSGLFFLSYERYFALFLLVFLLLLPLLSLCLSLPGLLRCTLTLEVRPARAIRGTEARWVLACSAPGPFPPPRVSVRLQLEDPFSGTREVRRTVLTGPAWEEAVPTGHCGAWTCTVLRARACDFLGLFSLPVACPVPAVLPVLPVPMAAGPVPRLEAEQGRDLGWTPRPGGGPGEDYDLRDHRPGDPLRAVHWKLSAKRGQLVVKETLEPRRAALVLTFDHFGTPEELDAVLDRLKAVSRLLLERHAPHFIQWLHPVSGAAQCRSVTDEASLLQVLSHILSQPVPAEGRSILDAAPPLPPGQGPPRRFHITPDLWQEGGNL